MPTDPKQVLMACRKAFAIVDPHSQELMLLDCGAPAVFVKWHQASRTASTSCGGTVVPVLITVFWEGK